MKKVEILGTVAMECITMEEDRHVQSAYQQVDSDELRGLTGQAPRASAEALDQYSAVSRCLGPSVLPKHQRLLADAATFLIAVFRGPSEIVPIPLWVRLMHSRRGGLRQVSPEWRSSADAFLSRAGLPVSSQLTVTKDAHLAYRLGQYDLAPSNLLSSPSADDRALGFRIQIAQADLNAMLLSEILNLPMAGMLQQSVLASYIVKAERLSFCYDESLLDHLESITTLAVDATQAETLRACHIRNSLNFVHMRRNHDDKVRANLNFIARLLKPHLGEGWAKHIQGNSEFHKSILARRNGDVVGELFFLKRADGFDADFADYHYRIAQILHDQGSADARARYENAIKLGPPTFALTNDYGCFLNDRGSKAELDSWEQAVSRLYPNGAETGP